MTSASEDGRLKRPLPMSGWRMGAALLALGLLAACGNDSTRARESVDRGTQFAKAEQRAAAIQAFFSAVEADPEYRPAHEELLKLWYQQRTRLALGPAAEHPEAKRLLGEIDAKYQQWLAKFPNSHEITRAYGSMLKAKSDPRALEVLLKVVAHDPKDAEVWRKLAEQAELGGDLVKSSEYYHKAALLKPASADDQYYYVGSLYNIDKARWRSESFELARRFPTSERGAQALYWIVQQGGGDDEAKIAVFEQLMRDFPPQKFQWSSSSTRSLFDLYLRSKDPRLAAAFAAGLVKNPPLNPDNWDPENTVARWKGRERLAEDYVAVTGKLEAGDVRGARSLIDELSSDPRSPNASMLVRLKAQALSAAGDNQQAYKVLLAGAVDEPVPENLSALQGLGKQLGKTQQEVDAALVSARIGQSKTPPEFGLRDFTTGRPVSLSDYRGKVVLLSFWYPNCGPCRGEMPHMDSVVRSLQSTDLLYLAPNGYPEEDGLVGPFVKKMGYSFTPLLVTSKKAIMDPKGPNIQGFPANYLIDREGRVAYRGFMVQDEDAKKVLKARIEALLRDKAGS